MTSSGLSSNAGIDDLANNLCFSLQFNGMQRVTAEEIGYLAGELEDTLSGIYGILSKSSSCRTVR